MPNYTTRRQHPRKTRVGHTVVRRHPMRVVPRNVTSKPPFKTTKDDFHLEVETAVYVPSTKDGGKTRITPAEHGRRVKEVREWLTRKFGGYTSTRGEGGYVMEDNSVATEPVVVVTSYAKQDKVREHGKELGEQLRAWAVKWGQESVGFEYETDMFYIEG